MARARIASLLCLSGLVLGGTPALAETAEGVIQESVLVRRVHRPVFIEPVGKARKRPGSCSGLAPGDLTIREDGEPVTITAIDETLRGTIHAVLIDTSVSMRPRLERAKKAAIRYIRGLPDEPVIVASFDDNLILQTPPESDREQLEQAILGLEVGNNTALWDALHYLIRYMAPYPGQKVIVLLSDGEDSASLRGHDFDKIVRSAVTTTNLTVFPIGLDLPRRSRTDGPDQRARLGEIARRTGGTFYEVERVAKLSDAFAQIRRRLEGKRVVTYIPKPFGQGILDRPDQQSYRFRQVEVQVRPKLPCRVISLAPPVRLEGTVEADGEPLDLPAAPAADELLDAAERACLDPGRYEVRSGMRFPLYSTGPVQESTELYLLDPPDALLGKVPDLTVERSVLYDHRYWVRAGRLRLRMDRKASFDERAFAVEIPPLDVLRETSTDPQDVVLRLLRRAACAPSDDAPSPLGALWVHGQTFLEIREALGLAIYRYFPDYRAWASRRMREDGAPEVEALLRDLSDTGSSAGELSEARRALEAMTENPATDQPQRYLAEWLGDVPARELALAVEARAAEALLAHAADGEPSGLARLVLQRWDALETWLPPPTRVRILTPLVPAFDSDRDVVGFYRIVLPRPRVGAAPEDQLPDEPYALLTLAWLLDDPELRAAVGAGVRLHELDHGAIPSRIWRQLVRSDESAGDGATYVRRTPPSWEVRLGLGDDTSEGAVTVTAYVPAHRELLERGAGERGGPFCVTVTRGAVVSDTLGRLHAALEGVVARSGRACPVLE